MPKYGFSARTKKGRQKLLALYGFPAKKPEGHGGSRGNGSHLSSNGSDHSEESKRETSRVFKKS